jgi:hypothetical protein
MSTGSINAHWAFNDAPKKNDFWNAIKVAERDDSLLRRVREEIRAAIRLGLGNWQTVITKAELFERTAHAPATLRPKFRMQGSFVYHTANDPAHKPPQQIDLDDGVYMPTEFIRIQSKNRPIVASRGFFQAVEAILEPLCDKRGWTLDKSKDSCVRVVISPSAHIDLPLYAIPSDQFALMTESLAKSIGMDAARVKSEAEDLADEYYRAVPSDQLMLAHRQHGWEPSDPRKIEDWFQQAIKTYGEVLRRLCKYLKAWRDHHWHRSGLSSLSLMACVVDILDGLDLDMLESRDDLAMLAITERLAARLNHPIPNPVMNGTVNTGLDRDWSPEERAAYAAKATELHQRISDSLRGTDKAAAVLAQLRLAFGDRVTNDESVIRWQPREDTIKSYPKVAVAAPLVRRTTSG